MANKPLPENRAFRYGTSFISLGNGVLFILKMGIGALYIEDEDKIMGGFIFERLPDPPKFGQEDVWSLHLGDEVILYDTKARAIVLTEAVTCN